MVLITHLKKNSAQYLLYLKNLLATIGQKYMSIVSDVLILFQNPSC